MKAYLHSYRQSPRKVRLIADLVKGKNVAEAMISLKVIPKAGTLPLEKLLKCAVSNAKNQGKDEKSLFIKDFRVDGGVVMKRMMPRARGSAYRIKKRTSHVTLVLEERKKVDEKSK